MTLRAGTGQTLDRTIGLLSLPTSGIVSHRRLVAAGISFSAISHRRRTGHLLVVYPGVYAVGHGHLTFEARWWAALLAAGPTARLAGRSGLEAHDCLRPRAEQIHVAVNRTCKPRVLWSARPAGGGRPTKLSIVRRPAGELLNIRSSSGLPTLPTGELLRELARGGRTPSFDAALRNAEFRKLINHDLLRAAIGPGKPGSPVIRAELARRTIGLTRSASDLEAVARDLFASLGMPTPLTNVDVPERNTILNADFFFPTLGLVIEADGDDGHEAPGARLRDLGYMARLRAIGLDAMRFSWDQLIHRKAEVAGALDGAGYLRSR